MRARNLGGSFVIAGVLMMSSNTTGAQANGTLRPEAVATPNGILDLVLDIQPGSSGSDLQFGPMLNDQMLFSANSSTTGNELWITDGTANGTNLLKDIQPGNASSSPRDLAQIGDKVFFAADDGIHGLELWVTDGTANGTMLLKDINTGSSNNFPLSSWPSGFFAYGSQVLFMAETASAGQELWVTDGTANGTMLLKDINTVSVNSAPRNFTAFQGKVYFSATDGTNGEELWVTDGTANGTSILRDIYTGSNSSSPSSFVVFQEKLYFSATDGTNGYELWVTDGTANGTSILRDIYTGSTSGSANSSGASQFTVLGSKLLFVATDGTNGYELWVTDGTANGTSILRDIYTGSNSSSPRSMKVIDDEMYFYASDVTTGNEPWKTNGTSDGTVRVADIYSGTNSSLVSCYFCYQSTATFQAYADSVIFFANDGINGSEPFIVNGTTMVVTVLADIRPGSSGSVSGGFYSSSAQFAVVGGRLLFAADNGQSGSELWSFTSLPGAPQTATAAPSTNSALVSWLAPSVAGARITAYTVTSNPGAFTCTTAGLSCTVTGLLSNQDYTFTVTATSSTGTGPASIPSQRIRTLSPQLGSLLASMTAVTDIVSDTTLAPGESVTTLYTGFNPNELVLMLMASNPVVIGSANADANGNVAITGNIPANASAGSHTLALYAPVSGFGAKQPITITANGSSSGSGSGIQSPNVDPNTLPATGRGVDLTLWAYLMLIIGLGIVASRRIMAPFVGNHPRRTR